MKIFSPGVGEPIEIRNESYHFQPIPNFPLTLYKADKENSDVYLLKRHSDSVLFALKVFKNDKYRGERLANSTEKLLQFNTLYGLDEITNRICITQNKNKQLVEKFPELQYSILMPWIRGETWKEIVGHKKGLDFQKSLRISQKLATILATLEINGIAHCDISGDNLMIDIDDERLQLIDLEDIFAPNFKRPNVAVKGKDGYQHSTLLQVEDSDQWCGEGDRFAGAVLISEILCWHDPKIRSASDYEQYFISKDDIQKDNSPRYQLMLEVLHETNEDAKQLFLQAWHSKSLLDCPPLVEWAECLGVSLSDPLKVIQILWRHAININRFSDVPKLAERITNLGHSLTVEQKNDVIKANAIITVLGKLHEAIQSKNDIRIILAYEKEILEPILTKNDIDEISKAKQRLKLKPVLIRAIKCNNDRLICKLFTPNLFSDSNSFSQDQMRRIQLALEYKTQVEIVREAIRKKDPKTIIDALGQQDLLGITNLLSKHEHRWILWARQQINSGI